MLSFVDLTVLPSREKNHVGNYGQNKTLWKKINVTINTHEDPQHISNGHR